MINIEEFQKLDIRVGTIVAAEKIEWSEKLLKLSVDLGDEQRQVIAGIGKSYEPVILIGKQIIMIANLEPRKFMLGPRSSSGELGGLESQGMILAVSSSDGPVLLVPEKPVLSGASVK